MNEKKSEYLEAKDYENILILKLKHKHSQSSVYLFNIHSARRGSRRFTEKICKLASAVYGANDEYGVRICDGIVICGDFNCNIYSELDNEKLKLPDNISIIRLDDDTYRPKRPIDYFLFAGNPLRSSVTLHGASLFGISHDLSQLFSSEVNSKVSALLKSDKRLLNHPITCAIIKFS